MSAAIERDGEAHRALLAGDVGRAADAFSSAADLYRRSWEVASPTSYGRLVGMLKSAVLAGDSEEPARYVEAALAGDERAVSPTAWYAKALAALILDDDVAAGEAAGAMRSGGDAFERTAAAIAALAARDQPAYAAALRAIVSDFEERAGHLTGVAIADTALMLERLAARRGLHGEVRSPLLPTAAS